MGEVWEMLPWDSEFFGFPVARIMPARLSAFGLEAALEGMRATQVRLVYWACDTMDPSSGAAAEAHGGFTADLRVTFSRTLPATKAPSDPLSAIVELDASARRHWETPLLALGMRAGIHSRFRMDPRFPPEVFGRLYREWMRKSLSGDLADAVLAVPGPGGPAGMVTVSSRDGEGRIGLLAIDAGEEGRGWGTTLTWAAIGWSAARGCREMRVVTQGRNLAACRVYEKCGFAVEKREDVRHFWL